MERPNSRMILQRVEPRPDSSGQFTVTMVGSPEFFPGSIKTASSLRIPIEKKNEISMAAAAAPNRGLKKNIWQKRRRRNIYEKETNFVFVFVFVLIRGCRVAEWGLRV